MFRIKNLRIIILMLFVLALSVNVYAADGDEFSTNSFRINSSGQVIYKQLNEVVTATLDTITAAETGKTFIYKPTANTTVTLPKAANGLIYKFVLASSGSSKKIIIDPQSSDTLMGCVYGADTFATGDSLISAGSTGDSVTLVSDGSFWYCVDRVGTWVDNN